MKYFKIGVSVFAFEDDGSQDEWIKPEMMPMTEEEVDRHVNYQKYMTPQEQRELYLRDLKPLTRRQFKLTLLNHNLLDKVSTAIDTIEDPVLKMRAKIEFEDSTTFERLNPTLAELYKATGISESKLDSMWEEGLKL